MSAVFYFENAAVFACGALISTTLIWLVRHKPKYVLIVLLNSLFGGGAYLVFSLFGMTKIAVFSSFLCGLLGMAGFAGIF
ncbi:MAG: hypothetical protein LBP62_06135 [Clostridiales bacterium]|jgi:hypothetical protein|nr:hypothetical protein [Clostridiales bacterium]